DRGDPPGAGRGRRGLHLLDRHGLGGVPGLRAGRGRGNAGAARPGEPLRKGGRRALGRRIGGASDRHGGDPSAPPRRCLRDLPHVRSARMPRHRARAAPAGAGRGPRAGRRRQAHGALDRHPLRGGAPLLRKARLCPPGRHPHPGRPLEVAGIPLRQARARAGGRGAGRRGGGERGAAAVAHPGGLRGGRRLRRLLPAAGAGAGTRGLAQSLRRGRGRNPRAAGGVARRRPGGHGADQPRHAGEPAPPRRDRTPAGGPAGAGHRHRPCLDAARRTGRAPAGPGLAHLGDARGRSRRAALPRPRLAGGRARAGLRAERRPHARRRRVPVEAPRL
ncbi:MAG: hypothetical protein AVDCRST_MAG08-3717, partial [uncultured Acetobacteraceae bacterium]